MKKIIIILTFFLIYILFVNKKTDINPVMLYDDSSSYYELLFDEELLNINNFKLKVGMFTKYDFKVTKVYIKYKEKLKDYFSDKEYFSFDSSNINKGIENLKEEYNLVLKRNYLYDEKIEDIVIEKVEVYSDDNTINIIKNKYPLVKIIRKG